MAKASQQIKSEKLRVFSERFKSALEKSTFQDNEIAAKIGVAPSAISNWRQGLNMAKGKNLRRLAEVLDCHPGWLLGEEGYGGAAMLDKSAAPHGKDSWQQRALAAEKKLANLRSGLRLLLETSGEPHYPQKRHPASSLAGSREAEALKKAEGIEKLRAQE